MCQGVRWNDMPSGTDAAEGVEDGHMDIDTWTRVFKFTHVPTDLIFSVHYGCLQHFHSMAPIQQAQTAQSPGSRIVFTNADVLEFILGQLEYWWNLAKEKKTDKVYVSWNVGKMCHTIQDSYARGHAVRDSTSSSCGNIITFQGYDAQQGNEAHFNGDYTPASRKKEADGTLAKRYKCAVDYSAYVIKQMAACIKGGDCNFQSAVAPKLRAEVYNMDAKAKARTAGGTRVDFGKPTIATDSAFAKEVVGSVTLYNPKSTKFWKQQTGVKLCGPKDTIISKQKTMIGTYRENPFNRFVNPTR